MSLDPMAVARAFAEYDARIATLEAEKNRALDALAILGVPQGRARSVSNGIEVLSARFRKADIAQSATLAALEDELAAERERREAAEKGAEQLRDALATIVSDGCDCDMCCIARDALASYDAASKERT